VHIAIKLLIVFVAIGALFMGAIFIFAGGLLENYVVGAVLLLVGFGLLGYLYMNERIDAKRPIQQTFSVTMAGSGEMVGRRMMCRSCGAPLEQKDVTLMSGGLVGKCPYCGTVTTLEEQPKW
jgi:hypothetical protein